MIGLLLLLLAFPSTVAVYYGEDICRSFFSIDSVDRLMLRPLFCARATHALTSRQNCRHWPVQSTIRVPLFCYRSIPGHAIATVRDVKMGHGRRIGR